MKYLCRWIAVGLVISSLALISIGCATAHGIGDDVDTMKKGVESDRKHHSTPPAIQLENTNR